MINKDEQKIIYIVKYAPILFILLLSVISYFLISHEHKTDFQKEKELLEEQYITDEKKRIKNTVEKTIFNYLVQKESSTKESLKNEIRSQVNNAHNIASNIYNKYKDKKTKSEIKDIIKEALRDITFFEGRGYFFIYEMEGKNILNAKFPLIEGSDLWNYKDSKGTFLIQQMNKILKEKNDTFYEWYWRKNAESTKEYKKIGYFKKFEPFEWFIGTGEYIEDFTDSFKNDILNHLRKLKYKKGGYIFVFDTKGNILVNKYKALEGNNLFNTKEEQLKNFKIAFDQALKQNNGVFSKYRFSTDFANTASKIKISYIKKFDKWDWVIGTGFDIETLNDTIKQREVLLKDKFDNDLENLFILMTGLLFILLIISFSLSKYIEKMFYNYTSILKSQKDKLLEAQQIALIAEWELDIETMRAKWSNDIIKVFEIEDIPQEKHGPELLKRFMHEEDWSAFENSIKECIASGKDHRAVYRIIKPDRSIIWLDCRGKLNKETRTIMGTVQDITELKQKEKILYQQSRMAAMGEMIGNIAHQWRQPLSVISINAATMKASAELGEEFTKKEIKEFADNITEQSNYLSQTIDDFRNFFRSNSEHVEEIDLSLSVKKAKSLIKDAFYTHNITIIEDLKPCKAIFNESTFIQAILNIFNNAKDVIVVNDIDQEKRYMFIELIQEGNLIKLSITDSGGGINEEILQNIFEPYFTTKHESVGTGIGLYMTHEIITKHLNGKIDAETIEYEYKGKNLKGAKFTVTIPIN